MERETRQGEGWHAQATGARAAAADVLEVALPWHEVAGGPGMVGFALGLWQSGVEMERHPDGARIEVPPLREERDRG